jgi:amino acid adenylation domain-containing protein
LPFEKLLEVLQPERSTAHTPVVQVMFNLHNEPSSGLSLAGLAVSPFSIDRGTAKFDLSVALVEGSTGLQAGFEYNTDLFDRETIDLLLEHYERILSAVVTDAGMTIAAIPLVEWLSPSAAALPVPDHAESLLSRFVTTVAHHAERPAVETADGCLSYAQLDARANALADELRGQAGKPVALLFNNDISMPIGLIGVLKAGCTYVPLDSGQPLARLQQIVDAANIEFLVCAADLTPLAQQLTGVAVVPVGDAERSTAPEVQVAADACAYVLFTSGSTGAPKGVMQTHANVLQHARVYANSISITHEDRLTLLSGYGFDAAVMDIFGALLHGACLCPLDLRTVAHPLAELRARGVSVFHSTPTVFRFLFTEEPAELPTVRCVVLGGEEALSNDFALFCKQFAPPTLFVNGLGPSESTLALQFFADHNTRLPGHVVPVGSPVAGTGVWLVNADGSAAGISGELVIRSRHVSPGYWRQPALTAERFIPDPDEAGVVLYHTGDRARYLPDGRLVFIGRVDDQVKVRGHRIEPGEVEAAAQSISGVERCAVVLRDERLVAYIVGDAEASVLRGELQGLLPDYMVPSAFVMLDELPLTANGKLDKRALPEPALTRDERKVYVEPRNDIERQLVAIWSEVLGVDRIGVHDDFFALGGHSLMAAQLVARVTDSLQVGLPIRRLFDAPTVAGIAEHVETLRWALAPDDGQA